MHDVALQRFLQFITCVDKSYTENHFRSRIFFSLGSFNMKSSLRYLHTRLDTMPLDNVENKEA